MRLKQINLAGFKSFVDPTAVRLPGNRCSVVGPNGGGKSNIVDAVRWVMGESSAGKLRGESLADVIFHGSRTRKLAGVASVELIFDNAQGRVGGEYAGYAEIAIRRQVSRDSQSIYSLNGTRCRRRDIADIFLGTGFGPRSYSIIEQGMIGQLVEARPDDLRVYLEEAAGISKYKERRRETESRIRHTRANLDRLSDTREELGRTLERLQKQARAAERYRQLKLEERLRTAELHAIRFRDLGTELEALKRDLGRREADFERLRAEQQSIETEVAEARVRHEEIGEQLRAEETRHYLLREQTLRTEEEIQSRQKRGEEYDQDLDELRVQAEETARQLGMDEADIEQLQQAIADLAPQVQAAQSEDETAAARLEQVDRAYAQWQEVWDALGRQAEESARSAQVQASRIEYSEQLISSLAARLEQIAEHERAPTDVESGRVDSLAAQIDAYQERRSAIEVDVQSCLRELAAAREDTLMREADLEEARQDLQVLRHQLATLQAAQQAAFGGASEQVRDWLAEQGLDGFPRVGDSLSVVAGWEHAVEMVLGEFLQGLRVEDAAVFADALPTLNGGQLALVEARVDVAVEGELPSLGSLIRSSDMKLGSLLHGIFAAESDTVALAARSGLHAGESIVTRSGLWVGPDWLRKQPETDAGIIQRAQDLETVEVRVEEAELALAGLQGDLDAARELVRGLEEQREALHGQADEVQALIAESKADHGVQRVKLEAADAQRERLQRERADVEQQLAGEREGLVESRHLLAEAEHSAAQLQSERDVLGETRSRLLEELNEARQSARTHRDRFHALNAERQSHGSRLEATRTARQRLVDQASGHEQRRLQLLDNIEQNKAPLPALRAALETKLAEQHEAQEQQRKVRTHLDELGADIRELEAARDDAAARVEQARGELESVRVAREGLSVERANAEGRVGDTGHELATVLKDIPADAAEDAWQERLESLDRRLRRLQPVNLAAIEEYEVESERKAYLDSQHEDLERALDTLQTAIRKIDAETRSRFKETFETVNAHLQVLFPKLFRGGHAVLNLTGEDLLDTGVALMARPPGKRNASVHQLSGGEMALTAVALVFAIFQLNPSPVCILDEIDAPLDDTNVGRVAELIREMSDDVQFIVITHNKLTMETADHLIGVTMSEPGVSRLVSVDIEEAAAMAAS